MFSAATSEWFARNLGAPTEAQRRGWEAIAKGGHVLVHAPTGSGKTLAAFLHAIDRLAAGPPPTPPRGAGGGSGGGPKPTAAKAEAPKAEAKAAAPVAAENGGRILASPLARAIAKEKGVDLASVSGSGPQGRIVKRDVEELQASPARGGGFAQPAFTGPDHEDVPASQMRKAIARRLVESKQKAPHFYLTVECDAAPIKAFRAQANEGVDDKEKISLNDVIVRCVARALKATPAANASWIETEGGAIIRKHRRVHVGIAVAIEDGLITPVLRDADAKPLSQCAAETKDLIARARVKKLKPEEYTGSTISVSNLGMYGIEEFTGVINPPESTILAVGSIVEKPVVVKGQIVPGERMRLTLSCDHRVVDGALGAQLLEKIKNTIEHPLKAVI